MEAALYRPPPQIGRLLLARSESQHRSPSAPRERSPLRHWRRILRDLSLLERHHNVAGAAGSHSALARAATAADDPAGTAAAKTLSRYHLYVRWTPSANDTSGVWAATDTARLTSGCRRGGDPCVT